MNCLLPFKDKVYEGKPSDQLKWLSSVVGGGHEGSNCPLSIKENVDYICWFYSIDFNFTTVAPIQYDLVHFILEVDWRNSTVVEKS